MAERCASIFFDGGINPTPHLGNIHVNPRQPIRSAPRAPTDHPDQLVLLCRCLLYCEGSSAVALAINMIQIC